MSDYDTYSRIHCRSVYTSEDGLRLAKNDDVTKTVTLKVTPSEAGNVDINLPTSAGTLMLTSGDLDARNLVHGQNLVAVTPADGDGWLIFDDSDSANPKRVTGTALKSYIGSVSFPSATEAQMLVANSSGVYASVSMSGNATVSASGALTLADASVSASKLASDAVTTAKILNANVTAVKLNINGATALSGAVLGNDEVLIYDASSTSNVKVPMSGIATYVSANLTNGSVVNADLADDAVSTAKIVDANVTSAKLASDAVTTAKLADDCVTSAKLAPAVALDTSVEAPIVYVGSSKWRLQLSGNDLVFQYWNGSSWVLGQTISAP